MIKMANGSTKPLSCVKKGDKIATLIGSADVKCVLKFECHNSQAKLCQLDSGLTLTHKHPILISGIWTYPKDICSSQLVHCPAVYNLIVDHNHIAIINNVPCILLGHNYTTGILKDEYLGSSKVVDDLKQMPGWIDGNICFKPGCF